MKAVRNKKGALGLLLAAALALAVPSAALADTTPPSVVLGDPVVSQETTIAHSYQFPNATVTPSYDEDDGWIADQVMTVSITGGGRMEKIPPALVTNEDRTVAVFEINDDQDLDEINETLRYIVFAGCTSKTKIEVTIDANRATWDTDKATGISAYTDQNGREHHYLFVSGSYSWTQAYNLAKTYRYNGMMGYLATITSSEEYEALRTASTTAGWLGGTLMVYSNGSDTRIYDAEELDRTAGSFAYPSGADDALQNTKETAVPYYYWACGPEAGEAFDGELSGSGSEPNAYKHVGNDKPWDEGRNQLGMTKYECCLVANNEVSQGGRTINDITESGYTASGYADGFFVEFGGYENDPGEPDASLSGSTSYTFPACGHELAYSSDGSSITVKCNKSGQSVCDIPTEGITLTLASGTKTYDGETVEAVGTEEERTAWEAARVDIPAVTLTRSDTEDGDYVAVDAVRNAGYYKITATAENAVSTSTFTINKKPTYAYIDGTADICRVSGKTYDGTLDLAIGSSENWYIDKKVGGDDVSATATGTFDSAGVGTNKTVHISNIKLTGTDASNYVCWQTDDYACADITQREVTLTWGGTELEYTGEEQHPACELGNVVDGEAVGLAVTGAQENAGGGYRAIAALKGDAAVLANYKLPENNVVTFTIVRAAISPTVSIGGWTYGDEADEPSVEGNLGGGEVTYEYAARTDEDAQSEDGWSAEVPTEAGDYTVRATVAETANYKGAVATADFSIARRSIEGAKVALGPGLTANDEEQEQTVESVTLADGTVLGASDYTIGGNKATSAGTYKLTITGTGNYTGSVEVEFTVAPNPDRVAADEVVKKIDAIGDVEYTDECRARIDAARTAYDALTDAQRARVPAASLKRLEEAESAYASAERDAADKVKREEEEKAKREAEEKARREAAEKERSGKDKLPTTGDLAATAMVVVAVAGLALATIGAVARRRTAA